MSKFASNTIEDSIESVFSLFPQKTPKVILGVSGGADSMALLHAFFKLKIDALVVHINYGMRGEESDLDQELVEGMCLEWGFECCSVKLESDKSAGNFQQWAREERYRIFRELRDINKADCIAVAHHQDDQIETILQKLFRGSGAKTWQGMEVWNGELFRPFLSFSKTEILTYCNKEAIPFRVDESNLESGYARNFIRNNLEERLDRFFPGWRTNILGLAEKGNLTDLAIQHILESMYVNQNLELLKFLQLNRELKLAVLKKFITNKDAQISMSKGKLFELLRIEEAQVGTSIPVSKSLFLVRDRRFLTLKGQESKRITSKFGKKEAKKGLWLENCEISVSSEIESPESLFIDAGLIKWPLSLRSWEDGDRFVPLGMKGSQKVSDHLTNRKIPSSKREKALILSDVDGTIYAIIFPLKAENGEIGTISEIIKSTEQTTEYLIINLK